MNNIKNAQFGEIALIIPTSETTASQVALTKEQHILLQVFLANISLTKPLIKMDKDYDLVLKRDICPSCKSKF